MIVLVKGGMRLRSPSCSNFSCKLKPSDDDIPLLSNGGQKIGSDDDTNAMSVLEIRSFCSKMPKRESHTRFSYLDHSLYLPLQSRLVDAINASSEKVESAETRFFKFSRNFHLPAFI